MKDKLDKYLDLANEVHLANVPLDKPSAESLLGKSGRGTAQNFVNRFINFFGRHLFMTITSIIAVILTGIYLLSPSMKVVDDSSHLVSDKLQTTQTTVDNDNKNSVDSLEKSSIYQKVQQSESSFTIQENNISELQWDWVVFNINDWSFLWKSVTKSDVVYIDGKRNVKVMQFLHPLDDKYLIKVLKQLEDSIQTFIKTDELKSLANEDIDSYFEKLAEIGERFTDDINGEKQVKMTNLYAHIWRKIMNNPTDMMKIKSKGIVLPLTNLGKLGINFTDSTFSIPMDGFYKNSNYRTQLLDLFSSDELDTKNLPKHDILLRTNMIYEWSSNLSKFDSNINENWSRAYFPCYKRTAFKDLLNSVEGLERFVQTQSYFDIIGIDEKVTYNPLSPLIIENNSNLNYHDASLYFSNDASRKLYDYRTEMEKDKNLNDGDVSLQNSIYLRRHEIFTNMLASYKHRYLIPVDIQIPFYGFTKEELDTMPNATFVTLWYYPNEEFLSALPDDIRKQLEKEMKLVESVQKGEMQPEDACDEVKDSKSLLGLCNLTVQAISNLNLYPNPALDYINVKFDLQDTRFYKIILTDATGQYIKDLSDWTESGKNEVKVIVPTNGLQNGAYIIHVVTEKSEKLMSKFVVRK